MRKILYIIIFIFIGLIESNAQIISKELAHEDDILGRSEFSYSLKELKLNRESEYIQQLTPLLDTLASNESAEMYVWNIFCKEDSIITCIKDWGFSLYLDENRRKNIHGMIKYGKDDKIFFLQCCKRDLEKIMSEIFINTDTLIKVEIEYKIVSTDIYIVYPDISTRLMCIYQDGQLKDIKLIYNNTPIKWD